MGQRLVEGRDALRLAGQERMERQAHHRAALRALGVELVELRLHHRRVALDRRVAVLEQRHVVHLERIGHADQPSVAHLDRHRLVVVHHVERVLDALLRQHVLGRLVVGDGGRQPAVERLAAVFQDGLAAVGDHGALLVFRQVVEIARVVGAVAEQLPAELAAALDDLGIVIAHRDVQGDAAAHAVLGHDVGHAPEAHPVAVVAMGVVEHVRAPAAATAPCADCRAARARNARCWAPATPRCARRPARRFSGVRCTVRSRNVQVRPASRLPYDVAPLSRSNHRGP